jgi:hypothetical protein
VRYQVQYKLNSNTYLDDFEANSHEDIKNLFSDLSSAKITEIRKYKYEGLAPIPKDDNNYVDYVKCTASVTDGFRNTFKIVKVKKTISDQDFQDLVFQHIEIKGKKPDFISTNFNFKI